MAMIGRGCQLDDTGHNSFQKWTRFCKFEMPTTGKNGPHITHFYPFALQIYKIEVALK